MELALGIVSLRDAPREGYAKALLRSSMVKPRLSVAHPRLRGQMLGLGPQGLGTLIPTRRKSMSDALENLWGVALGRSCQTPLGSNPLVVCSHVVGLLAQRPSPQHCTRDEKVQGTKVVRRQMSTLAGNTVLPMTYYDHLWIDIEQVWQKGSSAQITLSFGSLMPLTLVDSPESTSLDQGKDLTWIMSEVRSL